MPPPKVYIAGVSVSRTRLRRQLVFAIAAVLLVGGAVATAQQSADPRSTFSREHHGWGKFDVGAWKRVRVLAETFNQSGRLIGSSTRETTTSLVAADDETYTLRIDVTVEVAGKRFAAQPQIVEKGYLGEIAGQEVTVKTLGNGSVTIDGHEVPTEIREVTITGDGATRVSTLHINGQLPPYVLQRRSSNTPGNDNQLQLTARAEVTAIEMPYKVLSEIKSAAYVKTVQQEPEGTRVTMEVQCYDVPGIVVAHSSVERNAAGQVVRRSTLELLDYGFSSQTGIDRRLGRRRLFHRRSRENPN